MSRTSGRDRDLAARRRRAGRHARERARNSRLALAGFVLLGALMAFGVHDAWTPVAFGSRLSAAEVQRREFADTRTGRIRVMSLDGAICREIQFDNSTGRFSNGKLMRCDEAEEVEPSMTAATQPPQDRAMSVRDGFRKR